MGKGLNIGRGSSMVVNAPKGNSGGSNKSKITKGGDLRSGKGK